MIHVTRSTQRNTPHPLNSCGQGAIAVGGGPAATRPESRIMTQITRRGMPIAMAKKISRRQPARKPRSLRKTCVSTSDEPGVDSSSMALLQDKNRELYIISVASLQTARRDCFRLEIPST